MKAEKAFTIIGKKLEKEYKKLGFKYSRKNKYVKKATKSLTIIYFSHCFMKISRIRL
jgi:hypothetical protein